MSTIASLIGQNAAAQARGAVDRSGDGAGARRAAPTNAQTGTNAGAAAVGAQDSVRLSAGAAAEVSADDAARGISDGAGKAAVAHRIPAELMAILDELDDLGV